VEPEQVDSTCWLLSLPCSTGVWLRASHLLGGHSTTWVISPAHNILSLNVLAFWDGILLCSSGWPRTHNPTSATRVLWLQACTTKASSLKKLFFFCHGVWTQGLVLARQGLYRLSHAPSPFCFMYFVTKILCTCPGWNTILLFCFVFFSVLRLELRAYALSHSSSPFFVRSFLR
jgi:hypothetical protein